MRRRSVVVILGLLLLGAGALAEKQNPAQGERSVPRDEAKPTPEAGDRAAAASASQVRYVPPRRGSPRTRIGAGVRGIVTQPEPLLLAPPHTAHSASSRPSFFWFLDAPMRPGARAVFRLARPDRIEPVAELELGRLLPRGIHRVELARHDVELEPGLEYQWSISIEIERDGSGMDRVDSSYVMYVATADPGSSTAEWAARSYWHDALASAMAAFEADSAGSGARADLEALLAQGSLSAVIPGP